MPLLNKRPFTRKEPSSSLLDSDKVFYCEITNEVFTDYDEYWERLVLCNAMVWTCELTGRPGLTYAEALESETKARKCLSNLPKPLHKPMIYIGSLTRRGRYADMSDDVFNFIRDRYFVEEEVEAIVNKHWYDCKVLRIIYPTPEEVAKYEEEMADTDDEEEEKEKDESEVKVNGTNDDDIQVVKVVDKEKKTKEADKKKNEDEDYPPFATYKYEVIEIEAWDSKEAKTHIVTWEQIRRNKGVFTREKCKLFLKQCVLLSPAGYWTIKERTSKRYDLANTKFTDIFLGDPPKFRETKSKKLPAFLNTGGQEEQKKEAKERKKRERKEAREKPADGDSKKKGKSPMSEEEKQARKKMLKEAKEEKREEIKQRIEKEKEDKKKEREIKKEEKRLKMEYIKDWKRKRDDLDCDDHKDLPTPTPVQCRIPDELLSDFIMVLEFVNVFTELLELKDVYPQGITFDMLEHALVEKEVAGVMNDIFQLLLQGIFTLQEEEDDEVEADNTVEDVMEVDTEDISIQEAVRVANRASTWSQQYQGVPLQKAPLDALTLTEVLRLHILASGATSVANARWRHFNRGGFKNRDDPGLLFKLEETAIIKALNTQPVFDLPLTSKLKILGLLIGQILTYASVRDTIDDNIDKLRDMKNKLRIHQLTQIKKEKIENAARLQEKREKKQKEREKLLKEAEKKAAAAAMTGEADKPIKLDEDEDDDDDEEEEEEEDEEERAARLLKEEKNKEARRQDFLKRERELMQQVLSMAKGVSIYPLGQDRAYRRYWIFNSLPGLFVEDNELYPGTCRPTPTPYNPESNADMTDALQDLFRVQAEKNIEMVNTEKDDKNNSDKENDGSDSPAKQGKAVPNKKLLQTPDQNQHKEERPDAADSIGIMEKMEVNPPHLTNGDVKVHSEIKDLDTSVGSENRPNIFGLCSADPKNCPVHTERTNRHCWYFFHRLEDFHQLVESLNDRGYRENKLKENLECYKTSIESALRICPVYKLDPSQEPELDLSVRKSNRNMTTKKDTDVNLNFPAGTPIDEIIQLTLRDMILETEEKIHMGMLGSLRVDDRDNWRTAIEQGSYVREAELDWGGRKRIMQFKTELGIEVADDDAEDTMDDAADIVKDLTQAILQLAQSIDTKYLQIPLAETDKARKVREKAEQRLTKMSKKNTKEEGDGESESESEEEEEDKSLQITDNALRTPMERWEKSLMTSSSLAQLCLHFSTLDNSITWSRSALNARCRICRRKTDAENMLLCDECDKGYHMYCLKPKLKSVPSGNWYCDRCKPKEKPKSPKKKRQIYKDVSDDESEEEEIEEENSEVENEDVCYVCEKPGTLICCDTCPLAYHKDCADLRTVPRGNWSCVNCKEKGSKDSAAKPAKDSKNAKESNKSSKDNTKNTKDNAKNSKDNAKGNKDNAKGNKDTKSNKDNSKNKENKNKKNSNTKNSKNTKDKNSKNTKSSPTADKKRRSDAGDNNRNTKKQKLEESETEYSPPRRNNRRSLVNDDSDFNSVALETVLNELYKHKKSWPFLKAVSKKEAPDYYEVVKKPMDFGKVREKLNGMKYTTDEEFIADVMLIFQNCQQYNMEDTDEFKAGTELSNFFMKRVQDLGLSYHGEPKQENKRRRR